MHLECETCIDIFIYLLRGQIFVRIFFFRFRAEMMALIKHLYASKIPSHEKPMEKREETKKAQEHKKIFILCHKIVNEAKTA
jgi:hypothetical protein